jgi:hypothetical protein
MREAMTDTFFDRCISCYRFRQEHTKGEDTACGWICYVCVMWMDGAFKL